MKIVVRCSHHLQVELPLHIRLGGGGGACQKVNKREHCSVNAPKQQPKGKFQFFAPCHLLVQKVQLCKIVVRCPHHLQLESPPHLPSLSGKWPS